MTTNRKIGLALIVIGIAILLFGASIFTYQGPDLSPIVSTIGLVSFLLWLPTLITGIVFVFWKTKRK